MIYLDYNATTPLYPDVIATMTSIMERPLNASSVHRHGQEGRQIVETSRESVARLCGVKPNAVVFNSGATEGNNTVLQHFLRFYPDERVMVSAVEHLSVLEAVEAPEYIKVTVDGVIDLDVLETQLKMGGKISLVSVMLVNNETGVIQPIKDIATLAHRYGALMHCDAVQAGGRICIDMNDLGVDFLTLSAHKLGGSQGVGALIFGGCGVTPVLLNGGGQEKKARAGTENVAGIAGFGIAVDKVIENLERTSGQDVGKNNINVALENALMKINENITIFSKNAPRIPNTTLFSVPDKRSESLLMALDLAGFAVSNGSACSSGTVQPSHVLKAMGIEHSIASGAIRVSTGWNTTQNDIDMFCEALNKIVNSNS